MSSDTLHKLSLMMMYVVIMIVGILISIIIQAVDKEKENKMFEEYTVQNTADDREIQLNRMWDTLSDDIQPHMPHEKVYIYNEAGIKIEKDWND